MSDALLELRDVHKSFGHVDVIKGISISVKKGEHVVIFDLTGVLVGGLPEIQARAGDLARLRGLLAGIGAGRVAQPVA